MNTSPKIRLKRSLVSGAQPTLDQLTFGELAVNHYDGTVFVRQDTQGVGINTRVVQVGAGKSIGRTFFVTTEGDDINSGLTQADALASIKKASEYAQPGDTIKVAAGLYTENNPVILKDNVSVEGFELRNCYIAPNNPEQDLFQINNACHLTDLAFIGKGADIGGGSKGVPSGGSAPGFLGEPMSNGAAVIAFVPLKGVAGDRFFDGARMIRQNADYIAGEAVGFLTSGFSGVAGSHRAQDAARLIDLNAEYIAAEAVGFITSVNYAGGAFTMSIGTVRDCKDDIHDILEVVAHDLRAGYREGVQANSKTVGAAQSYFVGGALSHILGAGVSEATIAAMDRAAGIATFVINNKPYGFETIGSGSVITAFNYTPNTGVATVTTLAGHGLTSTDHVEFAGLAFTCATEHSGVTTTIFPDGFAPSGHIFKIDPDGLFNSNQFVINAGISTIQTFYTASSGTATTVKQYSPFLQQFDTGAAAGTPLRGENVVGGEKVEVTAATYDPATGVTKLTIGSHQFKVGNSIRIPLEALVFTCSQDNNGSEHKYPRATDPAAGNDLQILSTTGTTITVNTGASGPSDQYEHTFVRAEKRIIVGGGLCLNVIKDIKNLVGIVTDAIGVGNTDSLPGITTGIRLEMDKCRRDVAKILKSVCYDITRGGNTKVIGAAKSYYAEDGSRLDSLVDPDEFEQSVIALEYSKDIARRIINNVRDGGYTIGTAFSIVDADYSAQAGLITVTTNVGHGLTTNDTVKLSGLAFSCATHNNSIGVYDFQYDRQSGFSTVILDSDHGLSSGDEFELRDLSFTCGDSGLGPLVNVTGATYDENVGIITVTTSAASGVHTGKTVQLKDLAFSCGDSGTGPVVNVSTAVYNEENGNLIVTVDAASGVHTGKTVQLKNLEFSCPGGSGITTTIFPDGTSNYIEGYGIDVFEVTEVNSSTQFTINVGPSTIPHTYVSGGTAQAGITTTIFPDGTSDFIEGYGRDVFTVSEVNSSTEFEVNVGTSTITTTYVSGGTVRAGVTTTIFPDIQSNDFVFDAYVGTAGTVIFTNVGISSIEHTYDSGTGEVRVGVTTTLFPDGTFGDQFEVKNYISDTKVAIHVGLSTFVHAYDKGGTIQKTRQFRPDIGQIRDVSIQQDSTTGNNYGVGNCKNVISAVNTAIGVATAIIGDGLRTLQEPLYIEPTDAEYDPVGGALTFTKASHGLTTADKVKVTAHSIIFKCDSDGGITSIGYPDKVSPIFDKFVNITETTVDTFTIDAGNAGSASTLTHTFLGVSTSNAINYGGAGISTRFPGNNGAGSDFIDDPSFSPGTDGPVLKGPYIRNCTNFVENSIGMRINGFDADPGEKDELGVQGSMSVDSYTQYNQGGIGVSITNGAYAQLVSIFTICCNEAIVTLTGGQCDLTNSNSSFGEFGLVSKGVGDENSSSNYRQTAEVVKAGDPGRTTAQGPYEVGKKKVTLQGIGTQRPYDGQTLFFDELYYSVEKVKIVDEGSGYEGAVPGVTFTDPTGPQGITAQGIPIIEDGKVTGFLVANSGTQYQKDSFPTITIDPPPAGGTQARVEVERMQPLYFKVASATLPHNGISTITMSTGLNNELEGGEVTYITRQSLQITSSHSFEYVGAGNTILTARPSVGGIIIQDNEVVQEDGGLVVYTSTDQAGNFRIGDGIQIDQATGTISGRVYIKSLFNSVTPFILALGG